MESESPPRIFFALGNPGRRYEQTRHNFGRLVLKRLLERWKLKLRRAAGPWSEARFEVAGRAVLLAEPRTYMNRVGAAAVALLEHHALRPDALVALYDDIDLPFGSLRLRKHGGAAGHRGMLSLLGALGTEEVARLRLGIGGLPIAGEVADFVLEEFSSEERSTADAVSERAADALECVAARGLDTAMNLFNSAPPPDGHND
ncbi:MAG: aminoacyl-tRNA hydrolase [Acidobacteriota bacterium]